MYLCVFVVFLDVFVVFLDVYVCVFNIIVRVCACVRACVGQMVLPINCNIFVALCIFYY